ncbi:MAG TPA: hypothetical protein VKA91_04880 [Nitrososphaeraceae archaeon]|nr:hypothetical protein [Nitrososphaeraceae archaeon]
MSRKEKERCIIDLYYNQGKTFREIATELRVSFSYIAVVIRKKEAEEEKKNNADNNTNKNQQEPSSSIAAKAYDLFSKGKTTVEVAIALNLTEPRVSKMYGEYWKLRGQDILNLIYKETNGKIWTFLKLYKELIKNRRMSTEQVVNAVEIAIHKLPHMETLYEQAKEQLDKMQLTGQHLSNHITVLERKISILDTTAFSSEQECKRTGQQLQELTAKKDRLEKWIANILNNDELKQMVKENVKAALSENKQIVSVALTALLQTLKSDPQMINIIYKILTANDSEQQKDDNNGNAIKYFESNKDNILDLAEKHFKNLVEALTNNAIALTAAASSNPGLLLPSSSSSKFLGQSNQSGPYRIEESESFRQNKGDIAD